MINQKPKLYHSQSHSSSSKGTQSVFRFLPVAIFALASALPSHDQEVLAYMLTRSILITSTTPSTRKEKCMKRPVKKTHKTLPIPQCGCFDCYISFWFRWDSSPNRELIQEAIEAFEEHLMVTNDVFSEKHNRGKQRGGKRGMGRNQADVTGHRVKSGHVLECGEEGINDMGKSTKFVSHKEEEEEKVSEEVTGNLDIQVVTGLAPVSNNHKGLTRKVLPGLMGLINSRFWSIWSPGL